MNIIGCVGPMANCVEDLRLFSKVALDYEPWDYEPSLIEIPWKPISVVDVPKKLTIGVMWNDGQVVPHPPVARALKETVDTLRAAGHNIVTWDPKYHPSLLRWINKAYFLDGAHEYHDSMCPSVDPPVPSIEWLLKTEAGTRCTLEETWKVRILIANPTISHQLLISCVVEHGTRPPKDYVRQSVALKRYRCDSMPGQSFRSFRSW